MGLARRRGAVGACHHRRPIVRRRQREGRRPEVFDADRHAYRMLGMGDIVALVEEVQKGVDMDVGGQAGREDARRRLRPTTSWPSSAR